jgi:uncharacterized protein
MLSSFASGLPEPDLRKYKPLPSMLEYAWTGDMVKARAIVEDAYGASRFLNEIDPITGLNALHIAVGRNNLEMTKLLVEAGIEFIPDNEGRMPSLIAAICNVDDDLSDYILEAEQKADSAED